MMPAIEPRLAMSARKTSSPQPEKIVTSGPPEAEAGATLTIDLAAIQANWRLLGQTALPVECAAVVKADGYGCGIEPVTNALVSAGCRTFFVADLEEARRVRAIAPEAVVYVLGGVPPGTGPAFAEAYARPVIGSLVELAEWDRFISTANWRGGAALHVDTGMNRLGLDAEEVAALAPRMQKENHGFTLLMSHLACAETLDHPLTDKQIRLFREIRVLFRGLPSSLANSSGIFLGDSAHCDLVRPGAALYGVNPTPYRSNPMRPVVGLQARIIQVRAIARGATVGYGAAWTAKRPSRIAIVAVGYADGYLRAASAADGAKGGEAIVGGKRCSLAGRISMDLLAIDVTDAGGAARRGELVMLIGGDIGVDELAAFGRTIGYEVLTSLGRRYHRVYRGG
jgi:alanine racemase